MPTLAPKLTPHTPHAFSTLRVAVLAALVATLAATLAACGGGTDNSVPPTSQTQHAQAALTTPTAPATTVAFEGCVLDQYFVPHEGVPVRVLSADGRLLANARSGKLGAFSVRLPAEAAVVLQVDAEGGESLPARTQGQDQVFATCLVARVA